MTASVKRARTRRRRCLLLAVLVALTAMLAGCSPMDMTGVQKLQDSFKFGDDTVADSQVVDRMAVPKGGVGSRISSAQYAWATKGDMHRKDCEAGDRKSCQVSDQEARERFASSPDFQCQALAGTVQADSPDKGPWKWNESSRSCEKTRKLSWLEATLWTMYSNQSKETISWLTTKRNTLRASEGTVSTLQTNDEPSYDGWFSVLNKYLPVFQGVLAVCAAVSLIVVGVRMVANTRSGVLGEDHQMLDRIGWICLGVFMGSSCVSIALTLFHESRDHYAGDGFKRIPATPALQSWTPGEGTGYFVSDWVRMQVDPFMIAAVVLGVMAAGYKLVTNQAGRDLVPLGKAMMWAIVTAVCLAGAVDLLTGTVDVWTSDVLQRASDMMKTAWSTNTLSASSFFKLDPLLACCLSVIMWLCNLVGKIFTYLRAGILPILVGVAPTFAAMSWSEAGRQSFMKVMGWLAAFLLYKPVAALTMAVGSAIMTTAGAGDDSQAITLTLTIMVVAMLPAMIKTIVPAVSGSVGGGGVTPAVLATAGGAAAGAAGAVAGAAVRHRKGIAHGAASAAGAAGRAGRAVAGAMGAPTGAKRSGHVGNGSLDKVPEGWTAAKAAAGRGPDGARTRADGTDARSRVPQGAKPSTPAEPGSPAVAADAPQGAAPTGAGGTETPAGPSGPAPDGANRSAARRGDDGSVRDHGF